MSFSDSESSSSSSHAGDYKYFRHITRDRLLHEMVGYARQGDSRSTWKVLIMDRFTVKIMSHACKMADITDAGVSLVEDIYKRRQPLPSMDAVYFIQPTKENVVMFLSDMAGKKALYKNAFVFFSSSLSRDLLSDIKSNVTLRGRVRILVEMNLEYFAVDRQGFVTDNEKAMEELFGDDENSRKADACLNLMAARVATVFASLREFPFVRCRTAQSLNSNTMTTYRDLVPTKLASLIWNYLSKYKTTIQNFPQTETCDLLIVDRSIDQIAPIIHEWTYDAMCHDLLNLEGNKYVHEVPGQTGGPPEKKEVLLEEHDPIWVELRHLHIADASERLHEKMTNFVSKNKAAQIQNSSRASGQLSTRELQRMVQALPQYSEQIDKLSLHVEIAGKINRIIREQGLKDIGQLEQDLAFGDAGTKEVENFLRSREDVSQENKLRLLMVYAAVHPEKFESKGSALMKLANLSPDDMSAANNMSFLGTPPEPKKTPMGLLKFDSKKKHGVRKERKGEETTWQLSRFYPMIEELIEKLVKGALLKDEYPCLNDPSPTFHGTRRSTASMSIQYTDTLSAQSKRTPTWARARNSDDGYSSDSVLKSVSSDFKKMGKRIFVFIVGGATRSELRACHKLSTKLNREIILGSTSIDDPAQFITKLKLLSMDELSLDDLEI